MTEELTRRNLLRAGVAVMGGAALVPLTAGMPQLLAPTALGAPSAPRRDLPWEEAKKILADTVVPTFPEKTFQVTEFGAKNDGSFNNTEAFKKAIAACSQQGGGVVVVPEGTWVTGAIHLLSNVNLHVSEGATLKFSGEAADYPVVLTRYEGMELMNHSPMIYAHKQKNIALTGGGTLDATGTEPWNGEDGDDAKDKLNVYSDDGTPVAERKFGSGGDTLRTTFVEPYECENVLIGGVTLRGAWFWQLHPTLCKNVTVDKVTVQDPAKGNSDGCDPESCDHVVISNCSFSCRDDTIAIKSGRNEDGRRLNRPCQNIVIMDSRFESNRGMVALGSEQSGGIRNVYCYNLTSFGEHVWSCLYIKSNSKRGGFTENIFMDKVEATGRDDKSPSSGDPAGLLALMTYNDETGDFPPKFDNINITNMTFRESPHALRLVGADDNKIGKVTVSDSVFTDIANAENSIENADSVTLRNVTINGKAAS